MKLKLSILCLALFCACESPSSIKGPFMGLTPTDQPALLAPALIATEAEEYNGAFSKDGSSFYYTIDRPEQTVIAVTHLNDDGSWSTPKTASFSGTYPDYDPIFSPDGSRLYFSSRRPVSGQNLSRIWYIDEPIDNTSEPELLLSATEETEQFYSSITSEGVVYFNSWTTGNIYQAQPTDSAYQVEEVAEPLNGSYYDQGDPYVSPKGDYMIFRGYREDALGRGDLYISFRKEGNWTAPVNLGSPINTTAHETCPSITMDGKMFVFASSQQDSSQNNYNNGELNIYYMSTDFIERFRPGN